MVKPNHFVQATPITVTVKNTYFLVWTPIVPHFTSWTPLQADQVSLRFLVPCTYFWTEKSLINSLPKKVSLFRICHQIVQLTWQSPIPFNVLPKNCTNTLVEMAEIYFQLIIFTEVKTSPNISPQIFFQNGYTQNANSRGFSSEMCALTWAAKKWHHLHIPSKQKSC